MKRDNTPWQLQETAALDWSSPDTPRSQRFDDVYYSPAGGENECEHVFLRGNHLPQRWSTHPHPVFCIVETGFGTGLNFLKTWEAWATLPENPPTLHYVSIEKYPLNRQDLQRICDSWSGLSDYATELLSNYPDPIPGVHRIVLGAGKVILDLWWEDVADALPELALAGAPAVDAWYLDGFSPARNDSMWTTPMFEAMAQASRANATLATFTAAGAVRRGLVDAGFNIEKARGFGRKRECMRGTIAEPARPTHSTDTPWDIIGNPQTTPSSALVIGAGLAGCTIAAALAQRGIKVTVLDRAATASGGSGNNQGILYTRVSAKHSTLTDFSILSYCFAHRFYQSMLAQNYLREGIDGALCGSFHQSTKLEELAKMRTQLAAIPSLAQIVDAREAGELTAIDQPCGGYWFPDSGWIRPASVCVSLLSHPGITLIENTGDVTLKQQHGNWYAIANDSELACGECAVIATGTASNQFPELSWLPLQPIRGQTTELPEMALSQDLRAGLCHTGYISPSRKGSHCIGATFDLDDTDLELRDTDHRRNLDALAAAVPQWRPALEAIDESTLTGRVGFRCTTPDYLPVVGPVPDHAMFRQQYAGLKKNAKMTIDQPGHYVPGLFLSAGHGSRGLTSTPLAAQVLASQICGEALPLQRELLQAITPARFVIRQLRRGGN